MKNNKKIFSIIWSIIWKIPFWSKIIDPIYWKIKYLCFLSENNYSKIIYNFKEHEDYFSNAKKFTIYTKKNESWAISWEIVKFVKEISPNIKKIFLPWENRDTKEIYYGFIKESWWININIITAWLSKNVDKKWNFENDPPKNIWKFNLIISQAMIEHIINPYKHILDLVNLLEKNWYLIINTNTPWFSYHRYPIDCQRFYPDWFEEIKKRLNLRIIKKYMNDWNIFYIFQKNI